MTPASYRASILLSLLSFVNQGGAAAVPMCENSFDKKVCRRMQLMGQELWMRSQFEYALAGQPFEVRRAFQVRHDQWLEDRADRCGIAESSDINVWVDSVNDKDRSAECVSEVTAQQLAVLDSVVATNTVRSRYRLHEGAGKPLCEDYWRSLTDFGSQEPPMVCVQKLRPGTERLAALAWKELPVRDHLQLVYAASLQLPPYRASQLPPASFQAWRSQFMSDLESGGRKPRLRESAVQLTAGRPEMLVSFEPDDAGCERTAPLGVTDTVHFFLRSTADPGKLIPVLAAADVFLWDGTAVFVTSGWRDRDNWELLLRLAVVDSSPFRRLDVIPVLTAECGFSTAK